MFFGGVVNHAANVIALGNLGLTGFLQKQHIAGEQMTHLRLELRRAFLTAGGIDTDEFFLLSLSDRLAVDSEAGCGGHGAGGSHDGGASEGNVFREP